LLAGNKDQSEGDAMRVAPRTRAKDERLFIPGHPNAIPNLPQLLKEEQKQHISPPTD